jgi:2-polyprenyl-3-methyl-5-hydroxy-6-metoxy-1,4-benzoquinol methylase
MSSPSDDAIARHYSHRLQTWIDEYEAPTDYPFTLIRLRRILAHLERTRARRQSVLDAGCGVGIATLRIMEPSGRAVGFDVADELIGYAQSRARDEGRDAHFSVGNVLDPGCYPGEKFDIVMALGVFQHVEKATEALRLMAGCLADDGLLIVSLRNPLFALTTFNRPTYEFFRELFGEYLAADKTDVLDSFLRARLDLTQPPIRKGSADDPGLDDVTFVYHNPFEIDDLFRPAGLEVTELDFYRHHALPPLLRASDPERFDALSLKRDEAPNDWRSQFLCSTYIAYARRARR